MKVLIRNLDRAITQSKLKKLFEPIGAVQSCSIVMDKETGKSKGFGFFEIPKVGEAKAVMQALNGCQVDENKIRVKKAEVRVVELNSQVET